MRAYYIEILHEGVKHYLFDVDLTTQNPWLPLPVRAEWTPVLKDAAPFKTPEAARCVFEYIGVQGSKIVEVSHGC